MSEGDGIIAESPEIGSALRQHQNVWVCAHTIEFCTVTFHNANQMYYIFLPNSVPEVLCSDPVSVDGVITLSVQWSFIIGLLGGPGVTVKLRAIILLLFIITSELLQALI